VQGERALRGGQNKRVHQRIRGICSDARNRRRAFGVQSRDNRLLRGVRRKNIAIREQWHGVLRVGSQTLIGQVQEGLVLLDREPHTATELLAVQGILHWLARRRKRKRLAGLQRLTDGENISGVQGIVSKKTEKTAMQLVRAGFRDDVDRCTARSTELRHVVTAVDLELLDRILAYRQAHTTRVIVGFASIHGHAVASAVAAVKRKPALWRLFGPEIGIICDGVRIAYSRRQQGKRQIIAAINRQVCNETLC